MLADVCLNKLLVPDSRESDYMLGRTVVPPLHGIGISFHTEMKILPWYSYLGELAPA